ncbi:PKD domain-containing protein [Pontibacter sp. E15-1]|uniref:PKD domain-containing protein n=1 Tax=Pontibacter sp. E15-1 TaxID=2919918 RepID=UPI001F4F8656|nr:PKD domain-containing protein [Pontibacter sp. E15-1]MCJ8164410.1 PKD domain-containing protein [Pontibacter sp. E15-1]
MKYKTSISRVYSLLAVALLTSMFTACSPDESDAELAPAPTAEMVAFSATPNTDNPNIITFNNETPGAFKAIWDFGNGSTAEGQTAEGAFAVEGDYTVKLTVFTSGGYTSNTKTIHIDNTNFSMLDREDYNFLTGGASNATGKTWVIEKDEAGHMGVGPIGAATPEWWSAAPNDKAGEGLYDDEMVFNLNGFAYTYKNNGNTFVNGANAAGLGGTKQGDDFTLSYTPPTDMTWSIVEENGKKYLSLSKQGFVGYYTGVSRYEILKLTENELYLKGADAANAANGWWLRLVPKGYSRPVVEKPYKSTDIYDTFDTDGNVVWKRDNLTLNESYDNPAPIPVNQSAKVAMYIKQEGQAFEFANMYTEFAHKLDLRERHVIKLKVFIPSYNDFTTAAGEDWANKNLLKQVSVKLQDASSAQPWTNQVEVKQQVNELDKWVELTFDFGAADVVNRKDLDRIVIQIGGEGNFIPGIFFLDDIELVK